MKTVNIDGINYFTINDLFDDIIDPNTLFDHHRTDDALDDLKALAAGIQHQNGHSGVSA